MPSASAGYAVRVPLGPNGTIAAACAAVFAAYGSALRGPFVFDDRYLRNDWPYGSAVWGKKEMVCPNVRNENIVSMYEGGSNLFWAQRYGSKLGVEDLWVKMCGNSHTGSFKDLGMTVLMSAVKQMIADGRPISAVACAVSAGVVMTPTPMFSSWATLGNSLAA